MRSHLFIKIVTLLVMVILFGSCEKEKECNASFKPLVTTNSPLLAGDSLKLHVSGPEDVLIYNWYGPNGFYSHDSAPALPGTSSANAGRYSVDIITKGGCIYTATTDSVMIGAPVLPCSLANNSASISGLTDISFYYITAGPNGGSWFFEANGLSGDAELEFFGNGRPAAGVYSVQNLGGLWGPGNVHVTFTASSSRWYGYPGTVYVSVTNNKVTASACSVSLSSGTFNAHTTGSFQLTQP